MDRVRVWESKGIYRLEVYGEGYPIRYVYLSFEQLENLQSDINAVVTDKYVMDEEKREEADNGKGK
jgi:hypothetical protein